MHKLLLKIRARVEKNPKLKQLALKILNKSPKLKFFIITKMIASSPSTLQDNLINHYEIKKIKTENYSKKNKNSPLENHMHKQFNQ